MGIDFCGFDIGMPHKLLNNTDIHIVLQEMSGKDVAKGVTPDGF